MDERKEQPMDERKEQPWRTGLSLREIAQVEHAQQYVRNHQDAGIPGHGQLLLIAKLANKLDDIEFKANNPINP